MVVEPSGRFTKEGKPIFQRKKTETDVQREISEQRVQTFGPGGRKISDTGRVKVTVGGEEKFVTPERALAVGSEAQKAEAKGKIKRREQLESTIKARFEREAEEAKVEVERRIAKKKVVKLVDVEKEEVAKPISRLETFSPAARKRLGITETPEGLLEVETGGDRKIIVTGGKEPTIVPKSAEFRTGFESQLGVGFRREELVGLKTPTGVLTFKTIQEPVSRKLKGIFEPSFEFFKGEQLKIKRELRGRPSIIEDRQFKKLGLQELRTIQLRTGQLTLGGEVGVRRQIAEQPLETAAIITTGAVFGAVTTAPSIAKSVGFRISSKILGTAFVGVTGVEAGLQIRSGRFAEAGEIIGERSTEALLFIGAGKLAVRGVGGFKRIRFERGVKRFERKLPKFTEQELKARLGTGGIETTKPGEIQTTFDPNLRVKTPEEALRIRIFAKAKTPLKRPQPPTRVAIIETEVSDVLQTPPKILTLEKTGRFDISAFGEVPKQFTKLRVRVGRLGDITIREPGIQKVLVKPALKKGGFKILKEPAKFIQPKAKPLKPFKGPKVKTLDVGRLATQQISGKRLVIIEPTLERPRIDITQFGGKEIAPRGIVTTKAVTVGKIPARITFPLIGKVSDLSSREAQDIISGQKLRTRLDISQKTQQGLVSDLERITGTKPKPAFDIASGLANIQDIEPIQEQRQLLITTTIPKVPERGRSDFPPPFEPLRPQIPPPPSLIPLPFIPKLFLGDPIKRKRRPIPTDFAFTPDFISSVLNQFGPAPKQRRFTGQERRFKVRGRRFVSPLPKEGTEGIFGLIRKQLEA